MSNKSLNSLDIEQLNQDLDDEGVIYDLNIHHIDVFSFDDKNEVEDGEKERS